MVTELVLNHTSDQHEWFQRARRAPAGSKDRDFYVWSDTPERYKDARIIFQDFEPSNWSWDPVAKAYYFHRFFLASAGSELRQPGGAQGNAARGRFLARPRASTACGSMRCRICSSARAPIARTCPRRTHSCANCASHIDENFSNRMLLAEANQWPEDAVAYLAEGKECHMAFHFPLMPRMFMSVRMEDRFPLTDIWAQTPPIDPTCQWALFLRNHDELTLEMVTDEERDYMYRAYAQESRMRINLGIRRRLAPLLGNQSARHRTHQWLCCFRCPARRSFTTATRSGWATMSILAIATAFALRCNGAAIATPDSPRANPQRLILPVIIDHEYHYQTVNVEAQESNRHSLLWWMRRLIALRRQYKAFGRGTMEFLSPENPRVLAFIRDLRGRTASWWSPIFRASCSTSNSISRVQGDAPIELFSHSPFPPIGDLPYLLTLGPHGFVWFSLEQPQAGWPQRSDPITKLRGSSSLASFDGLLRGDARRHSTPPAGLSAAIAAGSAQDAHDQERRHRGSGAAVRRPGVPQLSLLNVEYANAEPETYVLPLAIASGDQARDLRSHWPEHVIADVTSSGRNGDGDGILYDAAVDPDFRNALFEIIARSPASSRIGGRASAAHRPRRSISCAAIPNRGSNRACSRRSRATLRSCSATVLS